MKASATREILDEFMPYFCPVGFDSFNNYALTGLTTFLPINVYPEEIPQTIDLWFRTLARLFNYKKIFFSHRINIFVEIVLVEPVEVIS